ncbi:MAG TPA: hypothetical protein VIM41_08185 [Gammaproteobacteria bacterium]
MLNIVVALSEEARPFIQYYRLKRLHHRHAFPVYGNDNIQLIVSGVGNLRAAVATGYLAGIRDSGRTTAWLNAGIAGCKSLPVGETVLAHKIIDTVSRQVFYPAICFDPPCKTGNIRTVPIPEIQYPCDNVYDMEAAGFFSAAMRFGTLELIHCLKIVSDNEASPIHRVSSSGVVHLVEQQMEVIAAIAAVLLDMAAALDRDSKGDEEIEWISSRFHCTVAQQAQLRMLIQNWFALTDASPLAMLELGALKNTAAVLNALRIQINEIPVAY